MDQGRTICAHLRNERGKIKVQIESRTGVPMFAWRCAVGSNGET